jgi:hypothetical protein
MKSITAEDLAKVVSYDQKTGDFTRVSTGNVVGEPDRKGYLIFVVTGIAVRAHRAAWLYMTGKWPEGEIDHINGVTSDNRFSNLRECSHQQNNHNQPIRKNNTSGVKGVYWNSAAKKWDARVCLNYKIHNGGLFDSLEEASAAVRSLRERLHGEFANHG